MGLFGWRRWLRERAAAWGLRGPRPRRVPRHRPCLEALEDRLAPATLTWTGTAVNGTLWSFKDVADPGTNWVNMAAGVFAMPQNGDDLVFPAGAANLANTDDIPNLSVRSITFQGAGYSLAAAAGVSLTVTGSITDRQATPSNNGSTDATVTLGLNLPSTITVNGPAGNNALALNGPITGAGGMTITGSGTVTLGGAAGNSYAGTTQVNGGTLGLGKATAVAGPLVIGPASGGTSVKVTVNAAGATAGTVPVTVNVSGELDVNQSDGIGPLTLNGGTVQLFIMPGNPPEPAILSLNGDVTTNAAAAPATIKGTGLVSLGATSRKFIVADGAADPDLVVSAGLLGGPNGSALVKAGPGRMVLSGDNSYGLGTDVQAGALNLQNNNAAGQGDDINATITVEAGAALELQSAPLTPLDIRNGITLKGDGVGGTGALRNVGGTNVLDNFFFTLATDTTIDVPAGSLDFRNVLSGPGGLTKAGPGALTLEDPTFTTAANTYAGPTQVDAGLLILAKAGAVPGALTVGTGTGTAAQALLTADAATSPTTAVTVNSDGLLAVGEDGGDPALAGFLGAHSSDTIASLTLSGGTVSIAGPQQQAQAPASVLTLGGDVTAFASTATATIQGGGTLALGGADRTFTVADGSPDPDLLVSATVADGAATAGVPGGTSSGSLTLTPAGTAAGFALSTFATNFPVRNDNAGPLGIAFPASGGVLVSDTLGNVRLFPTDADGQSAASFPPAPGASYGAANAQGLTRLGNILYATFPARGTVAELNDDGTLNHVVVTSITNADSIAADPFTGHLFVSAAFVSAIYEVDPSAGTARVFANVVADGLTFDATTNTLYAAGYGDPTFDGHIVGFNASTGAVVFDSGFIPGKPDGVAVGAGALAGNLFVNTNAGTLVEVNLTTHAQTVLASGGSRGDFVSVDPTNDTLLLTQSGSLARLIPAVGGGFVNGSKAGLTKAGPGRMVLGATNSYSGTTQVSAGTLTLGAPSAVVGPLVVGDAAALAQVAVNNATAPTVPVTVNATGELDVNANDAVGSLTLNGGAVVIAGPQGPSPASTLTLGGDVTANASATTATIQGGGTLSLGGANRTFSAAGGGADPGLSVSAAIADGIPVAPAPVQGGPSAGSLTLTADGLSAGFTLSTFATNFPERGDGVGPLAVVFPASGGVLVSDTPGNVRLFPTDADGQNAANFPPVAGASYGTSHAEGMTRLGDALYLNLGENNQVAQINDDGTINHIVASIPNADGMAADPLTGRLFVSGFDGSIFRVDPVAGTATVFANVHADGLAFDAATNTLYAAGYDDPVFDGHIVGFNAATGAVVFDSGFIAGRPDGTAIGAGALAGNLFVNTNAGTLVEINLATHAQTLLASGGSRGDFVSVDPTNDTLFVTQSDRLLRLIPAPGSGFLGGSPGGLTKSGAGRMVLSGSNSYSGGTDVTAGELNVQSSTALGAGAATVETGAALEVEAPGLGTVTLPNSLTLNGSGVGGTGALRNLSGFNTFTGTVTLATDTTVGVDAGTLALLGRITGPGGLSKVGAGALTLGDPASTGMPNSYQGATQVNQGLLDLEKAGAVPGALTVGTGTGTPAQALLGVDGATAAATAVTVNSDGLLAVGEDGSDAALATFAGAGSSDTIAALTLNGGTVSIAGPQAGNIPASALTLGGDVTVNSSAATATIQGGGTLALGGATRTFTVADGSADPDLTVSATVADGGASAGLTKAGPGRMVLGATDSYTGTTQVSAGTLTLAAPSAVVGPLVVGNATALAQIVVNAATAPTVPVMVNAAGELDVNADDTIGSLALNAGTVVLNGASALTLGGDVTANASAAPATVRGSGRLSLGGAARTFTVADGPADPDLVIAAAVQDGGNGAGLVKAGAGRMVLSASNVYGGGTHVTAGEVQVQNNTALGTGPATVETGAALELQPPQSGLPNGQPNGQPDGQPNGQPVQVGPPPSLSLANNITLNGPGLGGTGALHSLSGVNSLGGSVTLQTDSAVGVEPGLLGLSGPIGGPGGLTKVGTGSLTLSGRTANTYGGPTAVNAGLVVLAKSPGVIAVPHDLTIGNGTGPSTSSLGSSTVTTTPTTVLDSANEQIADSARVTIASDGILNINLASETVGSLTGAGRVQFGSGSGSSTSTLSGPTSGTLAVGADNTSTAYAGAVVGSSGSLIKIGGGVFVLQAHSPFAGSTTVNGGTLRVDGSLAASPVVVNAGGTLGGTGTVGPTTVNPGGAVSPGDSPGILSVQGGITFRPGSVLLVEVNGPAAGTGYDQLHVAGPVVLNGATLRVALGFSPAPGQDFVFIVNNGSGPVRGSFAGIPEDAVLVHGSTFFDLSYAGGRGGDADLLSLSRGDLFVRALFADFNALSSRTTRSSFEGRVDGGESRLTVARQFFVSPDRRLGEVLQFYQAFGQPLDGRQGVFVAELLKGVPAGQVLIDFLMSPAFRRLHRGNRAFVRALFTGLLGHPPGRRDHLGNHLMGFYVGQLNSGAVSRAGLVKQLLSSDEVYRAAVLENFTTFLGMKPTPAQVQTLTGQLVSGGLLPDALSEAVITQEGYIDFFVTRAGADRAPGVVLVNI